MARSAASRLAHTVRALRPGCGLGTVGVAGSGADSDDEDEYSDEEDEDDATYELDDADDVLDAALAEVYEDEARCIDEQCTSLHRMQHRDMIV